MSQDDWIKQVLEIEARLAQLDALVSQDLNSGNSTDTLTEPRTSIKTQEKLSLNVNSGPISPTLSSPQSPVTPMDSFSQTKDVLVPGVYITIQPFDPTKDSRINEFPGFEYYPVELQEFLIVLEIRKDCCKCEKVGSKAVGLVPLDYLLPVSLEYLLDLAQADKNKRLSDLNNEIVASELNGSDNIKENVVSDEDLDALDDEDVEEIQISLSELEDMQDMEEDDGSFDSFVSRKSAQFPTTSTRILSYSFTMSQASKLSSHCLPTRTQESPIIFLSLKHDGFEKVSCFGSFNNFETFVPLFYDVKEQLWVCFIECVGLEVGDLVFFKFLVDGVHVLIKGDVLVEDGGVEIYDDMNVMRLAHFVQGIEIEASFVGYTPIRYLIPSRVFLAECSEKILKFGDHMTDLQIYNSIELVESLAVLEKIKHFDPVVKKRSVETEISTGVVETLETVDDISDDSLTQSRGDLIIVGGLEKLSPEVLEEIRYNAEEAAVAKLHALERLSEDYLAELRYSAEETALSELNVLDRFSDEYLAELRYSAEEVALSKLNVVDRLSEEYLAELRYAAEDTALSTLNVIERLSEDYLASLRYSAEETALTKLNVVDRLSNEYLVELRYLSEEVAISKLNVIERLSEDYLAELRYAAEETAISKLNLVDRLPGSYLAELRYAAEDTALATLNVIERLSEDYLVSLRYSAEETALSKLNLVDRLSDDYLAELRYAAEETALSKLNVVDRLSDDYLAELRYSAEDKVLSKFSVTDGLSEGYLAELRYSAEESALSKLNVVDRLSDDYLTELRYFAEETALSKLNVVDRLSDDYLTELRFFAEEVAISKLNVIERLSDSYLAELRYSAEEVALSNRLSEEYLAELRYSAEEIAMSKLHIIERLSEEYLASLRYSAEETALSKLSVVDRLSDDYLAELRYTAEETAISKLNLVDRLPGSYLAELRYAAEDTALSTLNVIERLSEEYLASLRYSAEATALTKLNVVDRLSDDYLAELRYVAENSSVSYLQQAESRLEVDYPEEVLESKQRTYAAEVTGEVSPSSRELSEEKPQNAPLISETITLQNLLSKEQTVDLVVRDEIISEVEDLETMVKSIKSAKDCVELEQLLESIDQILLNHQTEESLQILQAKVSELENLIHELNLDSDDFMKLDEIVTKIERTLARQVPGNIKERLEAAQPLKEVDTSQTMHHLRKDHGNKIAYGFNARPLLRELFEQNPILTTALFFVVANYFTGVQFGTSIYEHLGFLAYAAKVVVYFWVVAGVIYMLRFAGILE